MKTNLNLSATGNVSILTHKPSRLLRHLPRFFATLLHVLILPAVVQGAVGQYTYTANNGTVTITGYTGPGGAVVIPDNINGLPVTRIGDFAFDYLPSVDSVTIPNSVTSIGHSAFYVCTSLDSVTIGNGVTSIGDDAFATCTSLTSLTIPNSVTNIGDSAFSGCTSLTSVTIGSGATSIGNSAFFNCPSVTSVTIPNSVTSIGVGAFSVCDSLSAITVNALNPIYSSVDGVLFNKSQTQFIQCPGGKAGSYTIPDSVTSIWGYAFAGCTSLSSVTIPNSVTNIGEGAFVSCTSLTSVTVPNSITSIGHSAFLGCSSLTSVTIPNSVTNIGDYAFLYCTSLTSVTIPNSVTNIGDGAFSSCTSLTSVTIPNSITSIGDGAFSVCTSLSAITVDALNSIYSSVDGGLFNKSQTLLIQCPGGKAGNYAIPNSVASIRAGAFYLCASVISVTIPDSVTYIGYGAFANCTNLTGFYFQGNAPYADWNGSSVFAGSDNATVYHLPGTAGWGTTFADRPTALWVLPYPVILNSGPSFGVQADGFSFVISWATNISVVVEATTNLSNPAWTPVGTNTLTDGASSFSDPEWTNHPARFYRLRSP